MVSDSKLMAFRKVTKVLDCEVCYKEVPNECAVALFRAAELLEKKLRGVQAPSTSSGRVAPVAKLD